MYLLHCLQRRYFYGQGLSRSHLNEVLTVKVVRIDEQNHLKYLDIKNVNMYKNCLQLLLSFRVTPEVQQYFGARRSELSRSLEGVHCLCLQQCFLISHLLETGSRRILEFNLPPINAYYPAQLWTHVKKTNSFYIQEHVA